MEDVFLKKAKTSSLKSLYTQFFTAVFFILCISIIFEVILAGIQTRTPKFFGYSVSYVPTESMEPTIHAGDYVLFREATFDTVEVNDIVIYRATSGRFIIHRVIEKNNEYLICKGDNNPIADAENIYPEIKERPINSEFYKSNTHKTTLYPLTGTLKGQLYCD